MNDITTAPLFGFFEENSDAPGIIKAVNEMINEYINNNGILTLSKYETDNSINFTVKFRGENKNDDFVDKNIAEYIIELQNQLNAILEENNISKDKILIKVRVETGCKQVILSIVELVKSLTFLSNNMSGREKIIAIIAIVSGLSGYYGWKNYLDYKTAEMQSKQIQLEKEIESKKDDIDHAEKTELIKSIGSLVDTMSIAKEKEEELLKPLRKIIKTLDDNEAVSLNNGKNYMTKKKALEEFKPTRNPRLEYESKYADDKYVITKIDGEEKELTININDKHIKISFSELSNKDIHKLTSLWGDGGNINSNKIDLQINIESNAYRIKSSKLIGLGLPRENAENLQDIILQIENSKKEEIKK